MIFSASMSKRRNIKIALTLTLCTWVPGLWAPALEPSATPRIVIASLNIRRELDYGRMLRELEKMPPVARPDILLLQEVEGFPEECRNMVQSLGAALGLGYHHVADFPPEGANGDGLATLSRFRLKETGIIPLKRFDLVVRSRRRIALVQTVESPLGEVRLFNLHLDLRVNRGKRLTQLDPVLDAARRETRPVIIAGDFNTANYYWVKYLIPIPNMGGQSGAVLARLAESGFETPFRNMGPTHDCLRLRLDWIFLRRLNSFGAGIEKMRFSDHHAIWTTVGEP